MGAGANAQASWDGIGLLLPESALFTGRLCALPILNGVFFSLQWHTCLIGESSCFRPTMSDPKVSDQFPLLPIITEATVSEERQTRYCYKNACLCPRAQSFTWEPCTLRDPLRNLNPFHHWRHYSRESPEAPIQDRLWQQREENWECRASLHLTEPRQWRSQMPKGTDMD